MIIYKKASDIKHHIENQRKKGCSIGFIPTMGALHDGHLSLIKTSKEVNTITICSIFVNPAQFNNKEDFDKYPITIHNDIDLLELNGCDLLFLPDKEEIYPSDFIKKEYSLGKIENMLEGKFRPGHFQGVCLVMEILLSVVQCDILYLGQKDYQQCLVIKKLITSIPVKTSIQVMPTIREKNGLAMSSRNKRLKEHDFNTASIIYQTLLYIKEHAYNTPFDHVIQESTKMILNKGLVIDYLEITDEDLNNISNWHQTSKPIALIAASIDNVRLIDNLILSDK